MRFLIWHAESDDLFEVYSEDERDGCLADGCDDVTDEPKYEQRLNDEAVHGR